METWINQTIYVYGHVSYGGTPKYLVTLHFSVLFLIKLVASELSFIQL